MSEKILLSQLRENIRYITINRPEKLNSHTKEVLMEMEGLLLRLREDSKC